MYSRSELRWEKKQKNERQRHKQALSSLTWLELVFLMNLATGKEYWEEKWMEKWVERCWRPSPFALKTNRWYINPLCVSAFQGTERWCYHDKMYHWHTSSTQIMRIDSVFTRVLLAYRHPTFCKGFQSLLLFVWTLNVQLILSNNRFLGCGTSTWNLYHFIAQFEAVKTSFYVFIYLFYSLCIFMYLIRCHFY